MSDANARCVVLMPVGNRVEPDCELALRALEKKGYAVRRVYGHSAIDVARSQMASDALADGFDELMWIDSDVIFDPEDVERLRRHEQPFVCGIYPMKGPRTFAANFDQDAKSVKFGKHGELSEVRRVGFGFNLTRRKLYDTMAEKEGLPKCVGFGGRVIVPYFMPMVSQEGPVTRYLGEDYAFCERARRSGFKVMADTTIRLWHVGNYRYGWEDAGRPVKRFANYIFHVRPPEESDKSE